MSMYHLHVVQGQKRDHQILWNRGYRRLLAATRNQILVWSSGRAAKHRAIFSDHPVLELKKIFGFSLSSVVLVFLSFVITGTLIYAIHQYLYDKIQFHILEL